MGYLLDADIKEILLALKPGTVIPCRRAGFSRAGHPGSIKKLSNGDFLNMDSREKYPLENVLVDVSNKRISIGWLISQVEQNEEFEMGLNNGGDGKLFAYNVGIDKLPAAQEQKELPSDALIMFRETMPKELVDQGLADSPTKITRFVYDKICSRHANEKRNAHGYDNETLLQVKAALDDPLAVVRSKAKDGSLALAVLTKIPDYKGSLSLVVIQKDEDRGDNWISSIYGKDCVAGYLKKQQEEGNLIYLGADIIDLVPSLDKGDQAKLGSVIKKYFRLNRKDGMNQAMSNRDGQDGADSAQERERERAIEKLHAKAVQEPRQQEQAGKEAQKPPEPQQQPEQKAAPKPPEIAKPKTSLADVRRTVKKKRQEIEARKNQR